MTAGAIGSARKTAVGRYLEDRVSAFDIALPLFVALFVSALATPFVGRLARRLGIVDRPNERKVSIRSNMPLMGGVSVAAGVVAGFAIALLVGLGTV